MASIGERSSFRTWASPNAPAEAASSPPASAIATARCIGRIVRARPLHGRPPGDSVPQRQSWSEELATALDAVTACSLRTALSEVVRLDAARAARAPLL